MQNRIKDNLPFRGAGKLGLDLAIIIHRRRYQQNIVHETVCERLLAGGIRRELAERLDRLPSDIRLIEEALKGVRRGVGLRCIRLLGAALLPAHPHLPDIDFWEGQR